MTIQKNQKNQKNIGKTYTLSSDDDFDPSTIKSGVKLKNDKSTVPKTNVKEKFEEVVKETSDKNDRVKFDAYELSSKFVKILQDTTLEKNKGPIQKEHEKDVVGKLINIAIDLNNDETQKEGIGSIGLATLLFNCVLKQRNILNELRYEKSILEERILRLEKLGGKD
jgi:hypothetical protein